MQKVLSIILSALLLLPQYNSATTKKMSPTEFKKFQLLRHKIAEQKTSEQLTAANSAKSALTKSPNQVKSPDKIELLIRYTAAVSLTLYVTLLVYLPMDFIFAARNVLRK